MDLDELIRNRQRFQGAAIIGSQKGDSAMQMSHAPQGGEESSTSTHDFPTTTGDQREDTCQVTFVKDRASGKGLLLSEVACTGLPAFPFRLHDMLNDAEVKGFDHVVSWQEGGRSFKVHDKDQFSKILLPRYFQGQTRYKSFQRQLNIYGFERILTGSNREKGGYTHSLLVRGKPMMCRLMIRTKVKNKGSRPSSSDSLARMKAMPTNLTSTSSMQNSSFPVQQHNSAPDFGALLNTNNNNGSNPILSNLIGSSAPRFSAGHTSSGYQNERFLANKSHPDVDERLLLAVASMCNDERQPAASHMASGIMSRLKQGSNMGPSNSSTIQRKTIEAFNRLSQQQQQGGGSSLVDSHPDVLRSAPGIPTMMNSTKGGGATWGQNNFASLLVRQGNTGGGDIVPQQTPSRAGMEFHHDMDDSDMESIFNEDDYAIDPPELPYICPDDSLASLSDWKAMESSVVPEVESATNFGGGQASSSCPVAADLVEVFRPC